MGDFERPVVTSKSGLRRETKTGIESIRHRRKLDVTVYAFITVSETSVVARADLRCRVRRSSKLIEPVPRSGAVAELRVECVVAHGLIVKTGIRNAKTLMS